MKLTTLFIFVAIELYAQSLTWDANKDTDLAGYKVYAGKTSGDYGLIQDVGRVNKFALTFRDGEGRFFAVTAYDRSGNESGFSEEIYWQAPNENVPAVIEWDIDDPLYFLLEYDHLDTEGNLLEPEIELQSGLGTFQALPYTVVGDTLRCSLANYSLGENLKFRVRLVNPSNRAKSSEWAYCDETMILIQRQDTGGYPRPVKVFKLILN